MVWIYGPHRARGNQCDGEEHRRERLVVVTHPPEDHADPVDGSRAALPDLCAQNTRGGYSEDTQIRGGDNGGSMRMSQKLDQSRKVTLSLGRHAAEGRFASEPPAQRQRITDLRVREGS